jgi:hypothetical protein
MLDGLRHAGTVSKRAQHSQSSTLKQRRMSFGPYTSTTGPPSRHMNGASVQPHGGVRASKIRASKRRPRNG